MPRRRVELRKDQRHKVRIPGTCRTDEGHECSIVVSDISASGCSFRGYWMGLSPGDRVLLKNDNGLAIRGTLRWSAHGSAGVQFDTRVYGPIIDDLAQRYTARE